MMAGRIMSGDVGDSARIWVFFFFVVRLLTVKSC